MDSSFCHGLLCGALRSLVKISAIQIKLLFFIKNSAVCFPVHVLMRLDTSCQTENALVLFFCNNYKGVSWVHTATAAAAGILARSELSYQSPVQDGEAYVARIRGKPKYFFQGTDMGFNELLAHIDRPWRLPRTIRARHWNARTRTCVFLRVKCGSSAV